MAAGYGIDKIRSILPHRYPFLLVDRVTDVIDGPKPGSLIGRVAKGYKNVSLNEDFFNGHFPTQPVMPGVLIIEAMAQMGGIACYQDDGEPKSLIIASVRNAKFRRPVIPGDRLELTGTVVKDRGRTTILKAEAHVDGKLVAESEIIGHISVIEGKKIF